MPTSEPPAFPTPPTADPQPNHPPPPLARLTGSWDVWAIIGAFLTFTVLLTGINYTLVESLKSELVARMDAQEATLQASIDTQTTTLGADIASLEASSTSEDERLRQSFATLSSEVNATIAKGLKNRNDAIRTALIGQLSSEQYYTVKAVNVPLDLLRTKEWKAVYGKLGTPRLYPFKDRVAFEVDVVDLDSPKGLALQELASFAFHPEIQFAVELKYGIPKLR